MSIERLDAVVIGAGQSGLGISRELSRQGVEHVLLDRGRIAESWRSQRWDAFALNSPAWMNVLPGDTPPEAHDEFPSAPAFALRLERYAFRHRLPVREGVGAEAVEPGDVLRVRTREIGRAHV